jgi:hypothetical protein
MMSDPSGRQIRSYHRAFHFELVLYTLGNVRPWRPVPARGVFYTGVCLVVMVALAHLPAIGGVISRAGPVAVYGLIPVALGWLLTVARVEGRRFHIAARVWSRQLRTGRTLTGGYRAVKRLGDRWRPARMLVINDGRNGTPPHGLRLDGPGRVLLRYPCSATLDGARLTVVETSHRPRDPGEVLTIAESASVRFTGATEAKARPGDWGAADPDRSAATGPGQRQIGAVPYERRGGGSVATGADLEVQVNGAR